MPKRLLKFILYFFSVILLIGLILSSLILYGNWKRKQHYDNVVTFYCRHKFVGCANENIDFEVYKVEDKEFSFLINNMVSLRWKNNPKLKKLSESEAFVTQDFVVKGIIYKYQFDVAISPLVDCELYAYRVDVIEMRPAMPNKSTK
jgi:hypothetical protein